MESTTPSTLVESVTDVLSFGLLLRTLRTRTPPTTRATMTDKTVAVRFRSGILKPFRFLPSGFLYGVVLPLGPDAPGGRFGGDGTVGF